MHDALMRSKSMLYIMQQEPEIGQGLPLGLSSIPCADHKTQLKVTKLQGSM